MPEGAAGSDDPIPARSVLWRRVPPSSRERNVRYWHVNQNSGGIVPTSSLFRHDPRSDGVSVTIADEAGSAEGELVRYPGWGLVGVTVEDAVSCGYAVRRDPIRKDRAGLPDNPA